MAILPSVTSTKLEVKKSRFNSLLGLYCLTAVFCLSASGSILISQALQSNGILREASISLPSRISGDLRQYVASVINGTTLPAGVYVEGLFAFKIIQQPADKPVYVSDQPSVVTQFTAARQFGSLGLLAHNSLAGSYFLQLHLGERVAIIDGLGRVSFYHINAIQQFQALSPESPKSNFIDSATNTSLSSSELFQKIYGSPCQLIFQTCITAPDSPAWGRYFVLASPEDGMEH